MQPVLSYSLPQGAGPPTTLAFPLVPLAPVIGGVNLDMTTVTGVTFEVLRPDGSRVSNWTGTIQSGATVGTAVGLYELTGDEFDALGKWRVLPFALVPGGSVPCEEAAVAVGNGTIPAPPAVVPPPPGMPTISVATNVALGQVNTLAYAPGAFAYVVATGFYWSLDPTSSASPNGVTVIAATGGGGNWLLFQGGASALTQAAWWVDPVSGNDANPGTELAPVQTFAEIVRRWGGNRVHLPQSTVVQFLSDQASGQDVIDLDVTVDGSFSLLGQYVAQGSPTTLATVTAENRGTPQLLTCTLTTPPAGLQAGWYLHNTTKGSRATIQTDSSGTLTMTQPFAAAVLTGAPSLVPAIDETWAPGDTIVVEKPRNLNLRRLKVTVPDTTQYGLLQAVQLVDASGSGESCVTLGTDGNRLVAIDWVTNCIVGTEATASIFFSLNGVVNNLLYLCQGFFIGGYCEFLENSNLGALASEIDGDAIIGNLTSKASGVLKIGRAYFSAASHAIGASPTTLNPTSVFYGSPIWWGPGQLFLDLGGGVYMLFSLNFVDVFKFTGGFDMAGVGSASAYNATTGVWTPAIPITPANLDTYGALVDPASGCRIAKVAE